ncbi:MAG: ABC transporter permease, partial [Acidobacteriota bacterium]
METLLKDLHYGIRLLWKNPGFTIVAVLSLALGIGANTTIFTLVNAVFLKPLPLREPHQLVSVYGSDERNTGGVFNYMPISYLNFLDYKKQNDVFSGLVAFQNVAMNMSTGREPEQINGFIVSGDYFDLLGVKAILGRTFSTEEDQTPGTHPVIVLGYEFWQRRFGGDPTMVGKTLMLNNQDFTVVGIAPKNFRGTLAIGVADFWVPIMMHDQVFTGTMKGWFNERRALIFNIVGRLKPSVTLAQAQSAMKIIAHRLEQDYPKENDKRNVTLIPLMEATINPNQRETFVLAGTLLMTVVGLVLLIACANVTNLLLARASARRREIAIRISLGADRKRLIRQLMTESLLLALLGGIGGLVLAIWGRELLWAFRPPFFPDNGLDLALNGHVLGFTLVLSLMTGIIFGLFPALQASKTHLVTELKDSARQTISTKFRFNLRNLLVISQVALSLISLIGAGLFLRSLRNAQQIDPGFETEKLALMSFNIEAQSYDPIRGRQFYQQVEEHISTLPGVVSASLASAPPFAFTARRSVFIEGEAPTPNRQGILVMTNSVGVKYFDTMDIDILHGRRFTTADQEQSPRVTIINDAMAKRFWPNQDAIGKRFKFFGAEIFYEVVGICENIAYLNLAEEPRPCVYMPIEQNYLSPITLHVRTIG